MPGAGIDLRHALLGLLVDLENEVEIPHLLAAPASLRWDGTTVLFAGDKLPTPFSGEGQGRSWQVQCRYGQDEQQQLADLIGLLRRSASEPDGRMQFRSHWGQVPGLDVADAVRIFAVEYVPGEGLSADLNFAMEAVG